ncbi:hypothetical protein [Corynebacterium minutissimum]|uniref:Hypothetical membrane protein n=1 Tax=Corynebacterium minutissimum TaxID=38301 RepID=A0A2X4UNC2_9CORY|nr:hypothetical protein [Corynebacterium minutissimum]KHO29098.1 membrane protein [Corynebacterium minutissimum]MCG7230233.1 hypothetical protein [Corynebacterium minutissimum]MCG7239312.1 hypothetical protein [Corynebacterium minutissimum]QPS59245.1 hypothetical protein I6G51_10140 [Corynebacterium minutissimum]QQA79966.1 hypothetical protein I6H49_02720 [Corynebacterium minutissimum]
MNIVVLILFLVAGLLIGGAWSAYQNDSKLLTVVAGVLAAITVAAALAWLLDIFSAGVAAK